MKRNLPIHFVWIGNPFVNDELASVAFDNPIKIAQ